MGSIIPNKSPKKPGALFSWLSCVGNILAMQVAHRICHFLVEVFNSHITENSWILSACLLRRLGLRPTMITWNTLAESNAWQVSLAQREAGTFGGQKSVVPKRRRSVQDPYKRIHRNSAMYLFLICIVRCF